MNTEPKNCQSCPHEVGDTYQRDCAFPDCIGGWKQAYKLREESINKQIDEAFNLGKESERERLCVWTQVRLFETQCGHKHAFISDYCPDCGGKVKTK
jgi:hypothetical protein